MNDKSQLGSGRTNRDETNTDDQREEDLRNLMTSRIPSAMMNISRATSPFLQIKSPGVNMYAFIFRTKSWRNSGWHS